MNDYTYFYDEKDEGRSVSSSTGLRHYIMLRELAKVLAKLDENDPDTNVQQQLEQKKEFLAVVKRKDEKEKAERKRRKNNKKNKNVVDETDTGERSTTTTTTTTTNGPGPNEQLQELKELQVQQKCLLLPAVPPGFQNVAGSSGQPQPGTSKSMALDQVGTVEAVTCGSPSGVQVAEAAAGIDDTPATEAKSDGKYCKPTTSSSSVSATTTTRTKFGNFALKFFAKDKKNEQAGNPDKKKKKQKEKQKDKEIPTTTAAVANVQEDAEE